jgi:hypothetical protein
MPVLLEARQWFQDKKRRDAERNWEKAARARFSEAADLHVEGLREETATWIEELLQPVNQSLTELESPLLELADVRRHNLEDLASLSLQLEAVAHG